MEKLNHLHMVGTAFIRRPPMSASEGEAWLRALVGKVKMEILFDAQALYCEDLGNEGVTGIVGLKTSHGSFHCWHAVERPFMTFDLYSCKDFEPRTVLDHLNAAFDVDEYDYLLIDRNNGRNRVIGQGNNRPKNWWQRLLEYLRLPV